MNGIIELVMYIVIPGIVAAGIVYGIVRRKRAMASTITDDVCVSCDSADVTVLGEGAYRCNACGYEGGSGLASARAQAREDAIAGMDPAQRRGEAVRLLQSARGLLTNAIVAMEPALSSSAVGALVGGNESQKDLAQSMDWFRQAQTEILVAMPMLGQEVSVELDVNMEAPIYFLDSQVDNVIANVAAKQKLKRAHEQGREMLRGVEQLLRATEG